MALVTGRETRARRVCLRVRRKVLWPVSLTEPQVAAEGINVTEDEVNSEVLKTLLLHDEALRQGRFAETRLIADDPKVVAQAALGQYALEELESVLPRRATVMPSWAPARIGRFEIRSVLGSGGFAVVYLAYDPKLKRQIALKVPRPHALIQPDLLWRTGWRNRRGR